MRGIRRCAICHRVLDADEEGDFAMGRAWHNRTTYYVSRDLWLCREHGCEVVKAIRAMAWDNPWAKKKVPTR